MKTKDINKELDAVQKRFANQELYPEPPPNLSSMDRIRYFARYSDMYRKRDHVRKQCNESRQCRNLPVVEFKETHISIPDPEVEEFLQYRKQHPLPEFDPLAFKQRMNARAHAAGRTLPYKAQWALDAANGRLPLPVTRTPKVSDVTIADSVTITIEAKPNVSKQEKPVHPLAQSTQIMTKSSQGSTPETETEAEEVQDQPLEDNRPWVEDCDDETVEEDELIMMPYLASVHHSCENRRTRRWLCWDCDRQEIERNFVRDKDPPVLVTSSAHKAKGYMELISRYNPQISRIDKSISSEIQGTLGDIAAMKANNIRYKNHAAVLVEDTGLYVDAWGGMPGPYVRHFDDAIPGGKLAQMYGDSSATMVVALAYAGFCDKRSVVFFGARRGRIALPVGVGYRFDAYLQFDGDDRVIGEYDIHDRMVRSPRNAALHAYMEFCLALQSHVPRTSRNQQRGRRVREVKERLRRPKPDMQAYDSQYNREQL